MKATDMKAWTSLSLITLTYVSATSQLIGTKISLPHDLVDRGNPITAPRGWSLLK